MGFWFVYYQNLIFAFDLQEQISSLYQKYATLTSDDYLQAAYSKEFSKDPFWDELKRYQDMVMHQKVVWVQYTQSALAEYNCSLSQDKVLAILYYFSPDFRSDIAYDLKMNSNDWEDDNLNFNQETISDFCQEYYACTSIHNSDPDLAKITSSTAKDVMTNCKEFFVKHYNEWVQWEVRTQSLQKSQLWADRFLNSTTDDSPYDIMNDFDNVWVLMFKETESPVQTVFYHLPVFAKVEKNIQEWGFSRSKVLVGTPNSNSDSNSNDNPSSNPINNPSRDDNPSASRGSFKGVKSPLVPFTVELGDVVDEETQDFLKGWLGGRHMNTDSSLFYWKTCEQDWVSKEEVGPEANSNFSDDSEWMEFTTEEYEDLIQQMIKNVDNYTSVPNDKEQEIKENKPSDSTYTPAVDEDDIQEQAEEIKNCYEKCDGLRIDQKASCYVMCSCGEWHSDVFNPEQFPWLGPILSIRFCAVPAESQPFSVGGKWIMSLEEWIMEILWVTDKLEREWKLWMWTPQHNFLDSTTKKMNFWKTISFTLSVDFVELFDKINLPSKQYQKREISKKNEWDMQIYNISNPLNNPVSKNAYRLIGDDWEVVNDYSAASNPDVNRDVLKEVNQEPQSVQTEDISNTQRRVEITKLVDMWASQQWSFWVQATDYANQWKDLSELLYSKK